jgi:hypothetical protein
VSFGCEALDLGFLRRELAEGLCRGMAREDPDFDSIRDLPAFHELVDR